MTTTDDKTTATSSTTRAELTRDKGRSGGALGNTQTVKSGARSPRVYGELAQHLAAGLVDDRPDLAVYPEAVAAWATAEAQAALIRRHLTEAGWIDRTTGEPNGATLHWLGVFERLAAKHRDTLGLDPRSEAALARERASAAVLAVDLSALAERGRAALAEHRLNPAPDLAGEALAKVHAEAEETRRARVAERERASDDDTDDDEESDR